MVVSKYFYFHPYLGKWSNLTKKILHFQMGRFNQHLAGDDQNHRKKTHRIFFLRKLVEAKRFTPELSKEAQVGSEYREEGNGIQILTTILKESWKWKRTLRCFSLVLTADNIPE